MKFIFLDIDGVLNNSKTKTAGKGSVFLDEKNVGNLKRIIKKTCAEIVLVSSWKNCWSKTDKNNQGAVASELDLVLSKFGLAIYGKTSGGLFSGRGESILDYIKQNGAESFVIIDDGASDYVEKGLADKWVRTDGENGGLTFELSEKAIKILNGEK